MYTLTSILPGIICLGSFSTIDDAHKLAEQLKQLGFCHKYQISQILDGESKIIYESKETISM